VSWGNPVRRAVAFCGIPSYRVRLSPGVYGRPRTHSGRRAAGSSRRWRRDGPGALVPELTIPAARGAGSFPGGGMASAGWPVGQRWRDCPFWGARHRFRRAALAVPQWQPVAREVVYLGLNARGLRVRSPVRITSPTNCGFALLPAEIATTSEIQHRLVPANAGLYRDIGDRRRPAHLVARAPEPPASARRRDGSPAWRPRSGTRTRRVS